MKSRKMSEAEHLWIKQNDMLLEARLLETFGIKLGDFGIIKISSIPSPADGFGLISEGEHKGYFVGVKTRIISGGYNASLMKTCQSELYVCPKIINALQPHFHATVGHEVVHVINTYLIKNNSQLFTERSAYSFAYNVYLKYGLTEKAEETKRIAESMIYDGLPAWGPYPQEYNINEALKNNQQNNIN